MGLSEEFEYLTVEWQIIIVVPLTWQFRGYTPFGYFQTTDCHVSIQGLHTSPDPTNSNEVLP